MIGIINRRQVIAAVIFGAGKATEMRGHRCDIENLDRPFVSGLTIFVPDIVERYPVDLIALIAERMDVTIPNFAPIDEVDAQFETALNRRDHLAFFDFEQAVEIQKWRNGVAKN